MHRTKSTMVNDFVWYLFGRVFGRVLFGRYLCYVWYANCELRWTDNSDDGRGGTDERVEISTELDDGQTLWRIEDRIEAAGQGRRRRRRR
jgi:hypothetical protein